MTPPPTTVTQTYLLSPATVRAFFEVSNSSYYCPNSTKYIIR